MEKQVNLQFTGYKVKKSLIEFREEASKELQIGFEPKGIIDNVANIFLLTLNVIVKDEKGNLKIEIEVEGNFKFTNKDDRRIEDFLYLNAPAILFPYVRAYINTLTTLSGNRPVTLPTLNLSGLRENLKNNTTKKK